MKISSVLSYLLIGSLITPASVFAQTAPSGMDQKAIASVEAGFNSNGVQVVNADGSPSSYSQTLLGGGSDGLRLIVPANKKTGLKEPLGILYKSVSADSSSIRFMIQFASADFTRSYASQVITYDFNQSDKDNRVKIGIALRRMENSIPKLTTAHRGGILGNVASLFLPKSEAFLIHFVIKIAEAGSEGFVVLLLVKNFSKVGDALSGGLVGKLVAAGLVGLMLREAAGDLLGSVGL